MFTIAFGAAVAAGLMLLLTGTKILQEYERGVVFRFGRARKALAVAGVQPAAAVRDRPHPGGRHAHAGHPDHPAGHHLARQHHHQRRRGRLRLGELAVARHPGGRGLHAGDAPARLDDAARGARQDGPRRHPGPPGQDQRRDPDHPRHAHRAVGRRDLGGRDQGHPAPQGDAAGDGAPGRGRARAARQGDRRRGRGAGGRQAGAGGADDRRQPGRAAAAALPDAGRGGGRGVVDHRLPGADRSGDGGGGADGRADAGA